MTAPRLSIGMIAGLSAVMFAGCATYRREPLPAQSDLLPSVVVALAKIDRNGSRGQRIDPSAPLDEDAIVAIAVLNNPDLRAERWQAGVADAQVFAAGLLPDPQVSLGLSKSSEHRGYDLGLSEELQSILTRGARRAAARAQARQVNLDILWQEWQVAEKARELFIQLSVQPRLAHLLNASQRLLADREERDRSAMLHETATAALVAADSTALAEINTQLRQLELQTNEAEHALHALLGLSPDVVLRLGPLQVPPTLTRSELNAAISSLRKRRPDLLALEAGYESQEARLRAAVLAQFPALTVGVDRARSAEEGIPTVGVNIGVSLPLFNANRGQIAIERATRAQLRQQYQARLDQALIDADRLQRAIELLAAQRSEVETGIGTLRESVAAAEREFKAGNLTLDAYANLQANVYRLEVTALELEGAVAQAKSALALVLGGSGHSL